MNPFELRGPEFLLFFAVLSVLAIILARLMPRLFDGAPDPALQSPASFVSDPYLIAHLRGDRPETLRVVLMSLVDRGLIEDRSGKLATRDNVTPEHGRRHVEREVLRAFTGGADARELEKLKNATDEYEQQLERLGLIPNRAGRAGRLLLWFVLLGFVGGTAITKIYIGMTRNRPVGFLIVLGILSVLIVHGTVWRHRTVHGDRFLASIQQLFRGLRDRADSLERGGGTADLALLAAAFGVTAVPAAIFPYRSLLYPTPPPSSSSGSSSSCSSSSSCGGGGGCGGGGCGGCGS